MAKTPLQAQLRPASFRGVPFHVEQGDIGAGRRTQVHEYPQRDKPWVEDLGRATRELSIEAFVVGEGYIEQANALLAALEEAGPGTLVHPWLGTLTVALKELARVSYALGQARISMSFIEAGELDFPAVVAATQMQTRIAADALGTATVTSFAQRFGVQGFQDFVAAAAGGDLGDMLGLVSSSEVDRVLKFSNSLANSVATAVSLISNPTTLGWKVLGMFGLSGLTTSALAWGSVVHALSRVSTRTTAPVAPTYYTPSRLQANANTQAVYALGRRAMLVQAVGASSLVGTNADSQQQDYNSLMAVRGALLAAIDAEALLADDAVYDALMDARGKVWADLTARSRDSARLTEMTPTEVQPVLVLAYDLYEDPARATEIVVRNGIRHPGFAPAQVLRVMTR